MGEITQFPQKVSTTDVEKALVDALSRAPQTRSVVVLLRDKDGATDMIIASNEDDAVYLNKSFDALVSRHIDFDSAD